MKTGDRAKRKLFPVMMLMQGKWVGGEAAEGHVGMRWSSLSPGGAGCQGKLEEREADGD